jgi:hypothetical protein
LPPLSAQRAADPARHHPHMQIERPVPALGCELLRWTVEHSAEGDRSAAPLHRGGQIRRGRHRMHSSFILFSFFASKQVGCWFCSVLFFVWL